MITFRNYDAFVIDNSINTSFGFLGCFIKMAKKLQRNKKRKDELFLRELDICVLSERYKDSGVKKFINFQKVINMYVENNVTHFVCVDEDYDVSGECQSDDSIDPPKTYTLGVDAFYFHQDAVAFLIAQNTEDSELKEHLLDLVGYTDSSNLSGVIDFLSEELFCFENTYACDLMLLAVNDNETVFSFKDIKSNKFFDVCVIISPDSEPQCVFSYVDKHNKRHFTDNLEDAINNYFS